MDALIVGVKYKEMDYDLDSSLVELEELCKACNIKVIKKCVQNLDKINPSLYIGTGKVQEIKMQLDDIDIVIFDEELSPLQIKNLTDGLDIEVTDRTDLILRIFEQRAKSKEAKLQVEIAKGQYLLPRLAGMKEHLYSQQGGSGFRGSGEKQIELDRRMIANQIYQAKNQLAKIVKQRQTQRKKRKNNEMKVIALVGYTNSGKSTLMNAFCIDKNKQVLQKNMLFATLQTATRNIKINHHPCLLTDTVGFINRLPHHLVQAFRSTLEEVVEADLLIHVVDTTNEKDVYKRQELYFPSHNVRYIAIDDGVDSEKGESEIAPFKNIINEWVARDTSRKVKSAFKTKFAEGAYYGAYAPLGYKKHPDIKGKLLVDEETKWIVEKIFSLAYQGYGSAKITKVLREEKVPTASWLNFTRYGTFAHIFEGKPESKRYEWTIAHVKAILKSEVYIGNSVHNRQSTVSFKSKKKVRKPESEWFRVENTHEPIIDKEVFYRVQEQIKSRRRQTKEKATPIFAGLVKCADCGWSMRFATNKANKTPYSYYACSYYGQFGKGTCSMHYIRYDVLYQAVLERLQYWAKAVQQDEEKVLNKIQKAGNAERIREKKKKASALRKAENRQNEIDRLFTKMYEDRACEKITERNFIMLSGKYQKEQIELEQQITNLREELSKMEQDMIGAEKWIELIKEYSVPKELTAPLLNAMIEKILIHEATTNEDNERIQEIEIYYRFIGKVD